MVVLTNEASGRLVAAVNVDFLQKNDLEDGPMASVRTPVMTVISVTKAMKTNVRRVFIGHLP